MLVLTFKINENAQSGDYIVSISYAEDEVVNVNDENVHFDIMNGVVTVKSLEPVTTEPVTTEPVTTEPVTTEPATTEPATTEFVTTEPATTEPVTTESATTEPVTTEPITIPEAIDLEPTTTKVAETPKSSTADQVVNTNQTGAIQTGSSGIAFVMLIVMMSALICIYAFSKKRNNIK